MFKKIALLLLVGSCISETTFAVEPKLTKNFKPCLDKAGGVTTDMINCISTELKYQDDRLNKAYKALLAELSIDRKKELQDVQRVWIKYRDANCKFYYDPNGGSIVRIASANCVLEETASRATELENLRAPYR